MPQHRLHPQTATEEIEEDVIKEDSGPPSPAPPKTKPGDEPVAVDPDDAMLEEPRDDAFKDTKPKPERSGS